jgi:hypothetical protein
VLAREAGRVRTGEPRRPGRQTSRPQPRPRGRSGRRPATPITAARRRKGPAVCRNLRVVCRHIACNPASRREFPRICPFAAGAMCEEEQHPRDFVIAT